uniref:G-protein coupled receptors family 1 profile domain-containing protein n=1 Tax=Meloidogyne incognita TaxID=6306 RepID=A0A914L6W1_MELIC
MTDIYNINNTLYTTHINQQFYSDLFLTAFIKWIICLPGIVNNLALICVTFREKSLRGPCNLLLALGALFEFFYLFGFTIPFLLALTTINFIPLQTCFYIQAIPLISLFASVNTVLFVGIDRLLNVILSLSSALRGGYTPMYCEPIVPPSYNLVKIIESGTPLNGSIQLVKAHRTISRRHGFNNFELSYSFAVQSARGTLACSSVRLREVFIIKISFTK